MENKNQAPYHVTMLVSPPEARGFDAFASEAIAKTWAVGLHYLAVTGVRHTPAHTPNLGEPLLATALFTVEVWDVRGSTPACSQGVLCFMLYERTAAACLASLDRRLRELAEREDEVVPTRYGDAHLYSLRHLEAAA